MADRPNVLLVFSDQHRATATGCYGNTAIQTPNIDAFVSQGALVQTAVSNTPVCGPYRASLLTGLYVHNCNYPTNSLPFNPSGPCLAEVFRDAGYDTGYIGKWHLYFPESAQGIERVERSGESTNGFVPVTERHGYTDYWAAFNGGHNYHEWTYYQDDDPQPINVTQYQPEVQVDQAIEFMRSRRDAEAPWFLTLSWGPPHTPFDPPPGYAERYQSVPLPMNVPPG